MENHKCPKCNKNVSLEVFIKFGLCPDCVVNEGIKSDREKEVENLMKSSWGLYQHYSGKRYVLLGIGKHSETLEDLVVYKALYSDYEIWVRPKDMFFEEVEVNGIKQPRFKKI